MCTVISNGTPMLVRPGRTVFVAINFPDGTHKKQSQKNVLYRKINCVGGIFRTTYDGAGDGTSIRCRSIREKSINGTHVFFEKFTNRWSINIKITPPPLELFACRTMAVFRRVPDNPSPLNFFPSIHLAKEPL